MILVGADQKAKQPAHRRCANSRQESGEETDIRPTSKASARASSIKNKPQSWWQNEPPKERPLERCEGLDRNEFQACDHTRDLNTPPAEPHARHRELHVAPVALSTVLEQEKAKRSAKRLLGNGAEGFVE